MSLNFDNKRFKVVNGRLRVTVPTDKKLLTEQSHRDLCDINNIIRIYRNTGQLPNRGTRMPQFLDVTGGAKDLQDAMYVVAEAQSAFEQLPSEARKKFKNDPRLFLEAVEQAQVEEGARMVAKAKNPKRRAKDLHNRRASDKEQPSVKQPAVD